MFFEYVNYYETFLYILIDFGSILWTKMMLVLNFIVIFYTEFYHGLR